MTTAQEVQELIVRLKHLRHEYGFLAETLVPDLALIGLLDDATDAAEAALEFLESSRPYRSYSMARVTFESSQRMLIIATADDYIALGTRAWLYYQQKDVDLGSSRPPSGIESVESQITQLWAERLPIAPVVMQRERDLLPRRGRGPDNFLGVSLAGPLKEAYDKIALSRGTTVPPDAVEVNRSAYSALSRDTHACVRLEPQSVRIDSDGFVEVTERKRIPAEVAKGVLTALHPALKEAIASVEYRLLKRRNENVAVLQAALRTGLTPPPSYLPDFGVYLLKTGFGSKTIVLPGVPIHNITQLSDETITYTLVTGSEEEARSITFDFKGQMRNILLDQIKLKFPDAFAEMASIPFRTRLDLPEALLATLTAALGRNQKTEFEDFIPLVVVNISWM